MPLNCVGQKSTLFSKSHFTKIAASRDTEKMFCKLLWVRLRNGKIVLVAGELRVADHGLDTRMGILQMLPGHVTFSGVLQEWKSLFPWVP
jgi:hypothetical protein